MRPSPIYGLDEIDSGTASFMARLQTGQPLVLFSDAMRQPIWVESLAAALLKLVDQPWAGTLNVAAPHGSLARHAQKSTQAPQYGDARS